MKSLWILLAGLAAALQPSAGAAAEKRHIRFDRISIEQGPSEGTVSCILQDSTGFLWLGSQNGLSRFDGHGFTVFRHDAENPGSITHNWIRALLQDPSGDIWVGTLGGGLNRWRRASDSFTAYRHDPEDPSSLTGDQVWVLYRDRAGTLWVGTDQSGLNRFDPAAGSFTRYRHDPADPASLADDRIRAVHEDGAGRLWVGTLGGGLDLLDRETGTFTHHRHDPADAASLADDRVRSILEDREGTLWIGTLGGVHRLAAGRNPPGGRRFDRVLLDPDDPANPSKNRVRVLYEGDDGRLWIGTDAGLYLRDSDTGSFAHYRHRPEDLSSLSVDRVASIYQDRGGVLWVGTEGGGVNKWHPRTWSFSNDAYSPADLTSSYILSIAGDGDDHLWLGTSGHGLNRLRRSTGEVTQFRYAPGEPDSLSDDRVASLLYDRDGTLWVGTIGGGLNRLLERRSDAATETFEHFRHDPERPGSLGADGVMTLFEDRLGILWIGTFGGGLNRFEPETGTFVRLRHDPADEGSLSGDRVSALAETPDGALWVGTLRSGLDRLDPRSGVFRRIRHHPDRPSGLSSDTIFDLHVAATGTLWVATYDGLGRLDRYDEASGEATFSNYFEQDGLPSALINAVYSDAGGRLWMATTRGLSRFDPDAGSFTNFDASHGLQGDEFNMGAHFEGATGELVFGGVNGFNAFFPDRIERNTAVPPVVLTSFSKLNRPVRLEHPIFDVEEISLSWRDHIVSFEFAALDYTAPTRNLYRYRLTGFDADWIDLGHRRRVSFTNLDPGRYELQIQGSNNDGVWNEAGTRMRIAVAPPPWKTWWAATLYALALVASVGAFVRSQQQKVERQRAIAERERAIARRERTQAEERRRLLEEREGLIGELETSNAELERFAYTVSHDLKSPLVTITGFLGLLKQDVRAGNTERVDRDIDRILKAAGRMGELLNALLQLSRVGREVNPVEAVPLDELAREAMENVAGIASERGVEIDVAADLPVVVGDRTRLLEVFQNLLDNAVRYMGDQAAPRVEVGVELDGDGAEEPTQVFYVRDNGLGIDPEYHAKVFGLFQRLDADSDGTGVGLALVKRIVEYHGGRVWIESEGVGHGSTFRFTLLHPPAPEPAG